MEYVIYAVFTVSVFLFLSLAAWKKCWVIFTILVPFIYGYFSVLVSSVYLELVPSEIYEQGVVSFFNWSSIYLVILLSICFFSTFSIANLVVRKLRFDCSRALMSNWVLFSVLVLELILIGHVFVSGSPLLMEGVTRFQFWSDVAKVKYLSIFNWLLYLIVFVVGSCGAFFLYKGSSISRFLSIAVFLLACVYFVSWGNKFSALLLLFFMYFIPGVISHYYRFGFRYNFSRYVVFFLPVLVLSVGYLIINQYGQFQSRGLDPTEQLLERIFVLQGHVWWGAFNFSLSNDAATHQLLSEVASIFRPFEEGYTGMAYLMSVLAPVDLFNNYLESGVYFTGGFPAITIISAGLIGGALVALFSWSLYALFVGYIVFLIASGSRLRLLFSSYLYFNSVVWFQRGSIDGFINWKTLCVVLIILFIEFLRSGYNRSLNNTRRGVI